MRQTGIALTITDDRGSPLPLWRFPHAPNGVPAGCVLSVREQAALEQSLGVPWSWATPSPLSLSERLAVSGLAFACYAAVRLQAASPGAVTTLFWGALACFVWLPTKIQRRACVPWVGCLALYLLALGALADGHLQEPAPFRNWFGAVVSPGVIFALPLLAIIASGVRTGRRFRGADPRLSSARVRKVMLAALRCPFCASLLDRRRVERDGCCVCRQCAGSWKVPGWPPRRNPASCPECEYSLQGLRGGPDYSVGCPECGATVYMPESVPISLTARSGVGDRSPPPSTA